MQNKKGIQHKPMLRIAALLLSLLLMPLSLFACADKGVPAIEYESIVVTDRMLQYWMSHYKAMYINGYSGVSDTASFWDSVFYEDMTAEQYFTELIIENVKKNVAGAWLFDYMGLKLTSDMKKEIKDGITELRDTLSNGSKNEFNLYLSDFGVNEDILYDIYEMDAKVSHTFNYLYGVSGIIDIPDTDREAYLNENYVHINHLYINNNYKYVTDEDGEYTYDEENNYITEALTDEEKTEKEEMIAAVDEGLKNGEAFESLWALYSEDKLYENGYYLSLDTPFITEVVTASFTAEIGEVKKIETEYGTHYIKRYEAEGTPWDDDEYSDFFEGFEDGLADYLFTKLLDETTVKITVHSEVTGGLKLRDMKASSYV